MYLILYVRVYVIFVCLSVRTCTRKRTHFFVRDVRGRGNMAAIIQTPAGTYSVRWREEGKHRAKTFKTKSEARTFLRLLEDEGLSAASSLTFSEAMRSRCSGSLGMLPMPLHGLSLANPNLIACRNTELMRFTSLIIVESLIMPPVFKLGVILRRLTYCSMSAG